MHDLIIKDDDPRYGKLGHLWKKYSYREIWYSEGGRNSYYYIPPELVMENYTFRDGRTISSNPINPWDNWIHCMKAAQFIWNYCWITSQEYFDLLVLHINDRSNRPRCAYCKSPLKFNNIKVGYGGGGGNAEWITRTNPCCDKHCASKYRFQLGIYDDLLEYIHTDPIVRTKNERNSFIGKGYPDEDALFYLTWTSEGYLKLGATSRLGMRILHSYDDPRGYYLNPHIIFKSNRVEIANLEARLKLEFKGREYLDPNDLSKLIMHIKYELANRPIANPFE